MTDPIEPRATRYAWYALSVLVIVYMVNFVDRQILSILVEDIKRDLGVTDGFMGFLYGTAFGVFYALFGIPLGRLADGWQRVRLITVGLVLWSGMTALSGFARGGGQLAIARIGVGIGEATASPSAYSLLSDWFPKRQRATALAIYSSGLYLGGGLSLAIGALAIRQWNSAWPHGGPFGLVGWQAAFLAVGIPGLLLAILVSTLKEPVRGRGDEVATRSSSRPFADFAAELMTIIPPLTLIGPARRGARALGTNLLFACLCAGVAALLIRLTGNVPQWLAVGIGVYAVFSWASALRACDPVTFGLIWGTPAFVQVVVGYGLIALIAYAVGFWAAPYAERVLHASKLSAALFVGGGGAAGGFLGVVLGGQAADAWRKHHPAGRVGLMLFGAVAPVVPMIIAYTTASLPLFYTLTFLTSALASSALGAAAASTQDLVLPHMRGTATATFFIGNSLIGLALGPSIAGIVSTASGSLGTGILSLLAVAPVSVVLLLMAWSSVPRAEATLLARARAADEGIVS